jgi:hypothetical protein
MLGESSLKIVSLIVGIVISAISYMKQEMERELLINVIL